MEEYTYENETDAREARRRLIDRGIRASLIAYDAFRGVYVFDAEVAR